MNRPLSYEPSDRRKKSASASNSDYLRSSKLKPEPIKKPRREPSVKQKWRLKGLKEKDLQQKRRQKKKLKP